MNKYWNCGYLCNEDLPDPVTIALLLSVFWNMCSSAVTLLCAVWMWLGLAPACATWWELCDNGKLYLERDLPSSAVWECPASITWPVSRIQKQPSIQVIDSAQPAKPVCMDKAITYNQTVPNSGASRPIAAESGEYLYCPPQRWINNLQHGAAVFLYHPCTPVCLRSRLSVLAHTCLSDYVLTPHPDLNILRPVVLVRWGRSLELSHVTAPEVCDWLQSTVTSGNRAEESQSRKYNLLLIRATNHRHADPEQKRVLKQCCEGTLSLLQDAGDEEEVCGGRRARYRRTADQKQGAAVEPDAQGQLEPEAPVTVGELKETNEKEQRGKVSVPGSVKQNQTDDTGRRGKTVDTLEKDLDKSRTEGGRRHSKVSPQTGSELPTDVQADIRADCDGTNCSVEGAVPGGGAVRGGGAVPGGGAETSSMTIAIRQTNEAVWAAAAVGFLLVLLVLSVLHTRLYRHWHRMPSMYWQNPVQDYELVADVRKRLKMPGRRKRRVSQIRRHECVLPPSSSTEEDE
ncbi:hypothetical protein DPEC_G00298420 [Dallia pectoralis]|uniref:Uncharacterized protein n=1 Tax=Dallia pectoralis TaxID=75939 RepID=A0ACC2FFX8_DALPE|nr:hypothetical protein DPEC_G00298420 [Dallia pectoralis]